MASYQFYLGKGLPDLEAHYRSDLDKLNDLIRRYKRYEFTLIWFEAHDETVMKLLAEYMAKTNPNIPVEFTYLNQG